MKKLFLQLLTILSVFSMLILLPISANAQGTNVFDYDSWYKDAKIAYDNYISILDEKKDDPNVSQLYTNADLLTRASVGEKKLYTESVKGGTEEEWDSFTEIELIAYKSTYLNFVSLMQMSKDYYEDNLKSGDDIKKNYFRTATGFSEYWGESGNEIFNIYLEFAEYQLQYFEYYGFPYNFYTEKSYAEETGLDINNDTADDETVEDLESLGLTENEIAEVESAINENSTSNTDSVNSLFIIIPIVLIFIIAGLIILKKNIKKD